MPSDPRKQIGGKGEALAAAFLEQKGFRVIARNWSCRMGEIDLIVQRGDEVRFVEVKTRYSLTYGYPEEAVTSNKLRHLARAIELWLRDQPTEPKKYQVDVIGILVDHEKGTKEINWIEGVL